MYEAYLKLSKNGQKAILRLADPGTEFTEEFKEFDQSSAAISGEDYILEGFDDTIETFLSNYRLVNKAHNYGSYSTLTRSLPYSFDSYCYVEYGNEEDCCIITSDLGAVYIDSKTKTVEGYGQLYNQYKDKYDELSSNIFDLSQEYFNKNYDFVYEHYYGN